MKAACVLLSVTCLAARPPGERRSYVPYGQNEYHKLPWRKSWQASPWCTTEHRAYRRCDTPLHRADQLGGYCQGRRKDTYDEGIKARCRTGSFQKECA